MVPANRLGYAQFDLPQLKVIQEVVHLVVFAAFAVSFMGERLRTNHALAALCLVGAVYFVFRAPPDESAAATTHESERAPNPTGDR